MSCWGFAILSTTAGTCLAFDPGEVMPLPIVHQSGEGITAPFSKVALPHTSAFPMTVVAEIDTVLEGGWTTFGDTDRDGLAEIVTLDIREPSSATALVIVERQSNNSYVANYPLGTGANYLLTYATGDLDADGRMEIIGQHGNEIRIYESPDSMSFPSTLVWTSPPLTNVTGTTTVADSDGDGRMEIIHSKNAFGGTSALVIFENTGDNDYAQVFSTPLFGNSSTGEKVVCDLDQDGKKEIAVCGLNGWLYLIESVADNQWVQVFVDSTGLKNAYAAEGGVDSDGNGRPELFIHGNDFSVFPSTIWPTRVYEASNDNEFYLVAVIPVPGYGSGGAIDALGDLDGDGHAEYIAIGHTSEMRGLWIYRAMSFGNWQCVAILEDPDSWDGGHYACNLDDDSTIEILWQGYPTSRILEYPVATESHFVPASTLHVFPNPFQGTARVRLSRTESVAATLLVYDVAGRMVENHRVAGNVFEWRPSQASTGVYHVRVLDPRGRAIGSARAVVMSK